MAKFGALAFIVALVKLQAANSHELLTKYVQKPKSLHFDFNFNSITNMVNDLCNNQLAAYQVGLEQNVRWARTIRDAWGKVPAGLLSGNYFDLGSFDQCIDVSYYSNDVGEIAGQHCTLMIPYNLEMNPMDPISRLAAPSRSTEVVLRIGICVPKSCSPEEVKLLSELALQENFNLTLASYDQEVFCSTRHENLTYVTSGVHIFAISFFVFILLLALASTAYEVTCKIKDKKAHSLLTAFSIYSNSKAILTMKTSQKEIVFLHGIRSIAILGIVWGHTYSIDFWMAPLMNANGLLEHSGHPAVMLILSGYLGVETFFLLSSMLMSLSLFKELDRTRRINIPILFVKRYFRITIPLAAGILFNVAIYMHLSNGPFWKPVGGQLTEYCVDGWWTNLIYLANYLRPGKMCFGHSWFLMVDIQLYFLSPLILYPIWKFKNRIGLVVPVIFALASSSVIYIIVMYLTHSFRTSVMSPTATEKENLVYIVAVGRLGPWMMGILVAYLLHLSGGNTTKMSTKIVSLGWIIAALLFFAVIFGQYPLQQENFTSNPLIADALYDAFKPIAWSLVVGWTIIACHLQHGNVIERFLSLSFWMPISKLSFCIYLTHVPMMAYFLATLRSPVHVTPVAGLFHFNGNFTTSFVLALILALLFEYPTLNIINIILSKRK